MSSEKYVQLLLPTGRLIIGDLYEPQTADLKGRPFTYKDGSPRKNYFIGVAIKKTPGCSHWSQEVDTKNPLIGAWGKKIYDTAYNAWGETVKQRSDFAWKIVDGDSQSFDKSTPPKRICDKPYYKGYWIINMGRDKPPRIVNKTGSQYILEPGVVKRGYFVQVYISVLSNNSIDTPGIHINHEVVSMQYIGDEIFNETDPASIGFGSSDMPPGASQIPQGAFNSNIPNVGFPPAITPTAPLMGAPIPPVANVNDIQTIIPNHNFVNNAIAPPVAPPPPVPTMTTSPRLLKNGATYDSYIEAGWTEEQLVSQGLL